MVGQDFAEPDTKITKFDAEDSQDAPNHLAASPTRHSRTVISGNSSFTMSKRYKVQTQHIHWNGREFFD